MFKKREKDYNLGEIKRVKRDYDEEDRAVIKSKRLAGMTNIFNSPTTSEVSYDKTIHSA
ncbi:MAG: hypothetical protein H6610_11660 [Ignavibacteriales bacterium]|nr:hypothetical protein [Ignavibacteriales bacterium]MCB9220100.1 hypothetical protein [Ignavibacteriales bacterium]